MLNVSPLESLGLPETSFREMQEILGKVSEADAQAWISKLGFVDGNLRTTYYADIQKVLSKDDFEALYRALGHEFNATERDATCQPNGYGGWRYDPAPGVTCYHCP